MTNLFENINEAVEFFCETRESTSIKFEFEQSNGSVGLSKSSYYCFHLTFEMKAGDIKFAVCANPAPFDLIEEKVFLITSLCNRYIHNENEAAFDYENRINSFEDKINEEAEYGRQQLKEQTNMLPHLEDW